MSTSYWHFSLVGSAASGVAQISASIIASSSKECVDRDLIQGESLLKDGIDIYFKEKAVELAGRDPKGAEVALAGFCALNYFSEKYHVWTPVHPPAASQVTEPESESTYVFPNGVRIWVLKVSTG